MAVTFARMEMPCQHPMHTYTILAVYPPMMRRGFGVSLALVIIDDSSSLYEVLLFLPVFRLSSFIRAVAFKCSELHSIRFNARSLYRKRLPFLSCLCAIHPSQAHCLAGILFSILFGVSTFGLFLHPAILPYPANHPSFICPALLVKRLTGCYTFSAFQLSSNPPRRLLSSLLRPGRLSGLSCRR